MDLESEKIEEMQAKIETLEADLVAMKSKIDGLRLLMWLNIALSVVFGLVKFLMAGHGGAPSSASGNSVQIGTAPTVVPQRDYLTTEEVAAREGVAARTVTEWAREGKFTPEPVKGERAWQFAADYRVLPQEVVSGK